jgi:hypothetical protein
VARKARMPEEEEGRESDRAVRLARLDGRGGRGAECRGEAVGETKSGLAMGWCL